KKFLKSVENSKFKHKLEKRLNEFVTEWLKDRNMAEYGCILIIGDADNIFQVDTAVGVLSFDNKLACVGSGGAYAESAALALLKHNPELSAKEIVLSSLEVASNICVYTSNQFAIKSYEKK
ncbi:MAG: hypothetical protein OXB93_02155, partial [Cytophagales bacterium]|nr:hypothetical protein [Cytophagales bacterium]